MYVSSVREMVAEFGGEAVGILRPRYECTAAVGARSNGH